MNILKKTYRKQFPSRESAIPLQLALMICASEYNLLGKYPYARIPQITRNEKTISVKYFSNGTETDLNDFIKHCEKIIKREK